MKYIEQIVVDICSSNLLISHFFRPTSKCCKTYIFSWKILSNTILEMARPHIYRDEVKFLRKLIQVLAYEENHNSTVFQLFCEKPPQNLKLTVELKKFAKSRHVETIYTVNSGLCSFRTKKPQGATGCPRVFIQI